MKILFLNSRLFGFFSKWEVYLGIVLLLGLILSCRQDGNGSDRSPEQALSKFQFADPDLRISLIASEPDIKSPVAMAWAPNGDLFVVEMRGYPTTNEMGSVKRLTDPDGDGRYNLASVFAGNLNFPTSVMPYRGGVLVTDAPDILFLKDTTGDGIADHREVLLTGFRAGNQQSRANALHWGLDNHIYGANGRSGGTIHYASSLDTITINNRDFRFDPRNGVFEAISGMSQFGLAQDNWGNRFLSYNHRFARQVILEEKDLDRNPSLSLDAIFDTARNEHDRRVYTLLTQAMRFNRDPIGYFTSLSGLTAYNGHLLGPGYRGDFFAGESVQASVIRRRMERNGVHYTGIDADLEAEFLASPDDWFHPVNFANGPDGALYIVDFYRKFVEHPQYANEKLGEGIDWNEGDHHGRIWRVAHKDFGYDADRMKPELDQANVENLVHQLEDASGWRRGMAQQRIVEEQLKEAVPYIRDLLDPQRPLVTTRALWTLKGLQLLSAQDILKALNANNPQLQAQGIKLADNMLDSNKALLRKIEALAVNPDQLVRFRAILALGPFSLPSVQKALVQSAKTYKDSWTRIALLSSTADWAGEFSKALLADRPAEGSNVSENLNFFRRVGEMVANAPINRETQIWISKLCQGGRSSKIAELAFLTGYLEALSSLNKDLPIFSKAFFNRALEIAYDEDNITAARIGVNLLKYTASKKVYDALVQLVLASKNEEIKFTGLRTLAAKNRREVSDLLFSNIHGMDPSVRKELISTSLLSNAASLSLLAAIEEEIVDPTEVTEELRYALLSHSNEGIKAKADAILSSSVDVNRQAVVDRYAELLNDQTVDLDNGALVFSQNCINCHAINGSGGLLGPDLTNIGSRSDEVLLVSILDPSRMVSYELRLHVIETIAGEVFSGTIAAETVNSITVKQPNGKERTVLKENIKKRTKTSQSIMPEGFERTINEKAMSDLIGYLRQPNLKTSKS